MKNLFRIVLFYTLFTFLNINTLGQDLAIEYNTGDTEMDSYLAEVNTKAESDYDAFRDELSESSEITTEEIDRYIKEDNMKPAEVYYANVLATTTNRPVSEVVGLYSEKKGWGAVAKELGIKPGSDEFHQLKSNTIKVTGKDKQEKNKEKKSKSKSKNKD